MVVGKLWVGQYQGAAIRQCVPHCLDDLPQDRLRAIGTKEDSVMREITQRIADLANTTEYGVQSGLF